MKEVVAASCENEHETNVLLETVVAAHYLALQMRIIARDRDFKGREATEFLAAALSEWASLVEGDSGAREEWFEATALGGRH